MKIELRWPTLAEAAIAAATVAVVTFFFVSNYHTYFSVFSNLMTAEIRYQPECAFDPSTATPVPDIPPPPGYNLDKPTGCGGSIPYRWILAMLAGFVGIVALRQRLKKSN